MDARSVFLLRRFFVVVVYIETAEIRPNATLFSTLAKDISGNV